MEESGRRGNRTRVSEHVRGVAIPLGRLKPLHRMVALPMLRDATGPVHFLPTCRPDCLRREVSIPVPSRRLLIYTSVVYMARANRISGCVSTISAQSPHRTPNREKTKKRSAELHARRTCQFQRIFANVIFYNGVAGDKDAIGAEFLRPRHRNLAMNQAIINPKQSNHC